jgi:CCR4-NOT complex subunit CAF16
MGLQGEIPLQGDFSAEHMIFGVEGVDVVRRDHLIDLLDIDLQWRMHKVSDGQRRRVQICMGLLHPFQVALVLFLLGTNNVHRFSMCFVPHIFCKYCVP